MLNTLKTIWKDIPILKILIQSDLSKEPKVSLYFYPLSHLIIFKLFYYRFPHSMDLSDHYILLLDPVLGTGASVTMAIRLLLDHGISQDRIIFVTFLASPFGLQNILYTFEKVKIITCDVDTNLTERGFLLPGLGNFGDR